MNVKASEPEGKYVGCRGWFHM